MFASGLFFASFYLCLFPLTSTFTVSGYSYMAGMIVWVWIVCLRVGASVWSEQKPQWVAQSRGAWSPGLGSSAIVSVGRALPSLRSLSMPSPPVWELRPRAQISHEPGVGAKKASQPVCPDPGFEVQNGSLHSKSISKFFLLFSIIIQSSLRIQPPRIRSTFLSLRCS